MRPYRLEEDNAAHALPPGIPECCRRLAPALGTAPGDKAGSSGPAGTGRDAVG